MVGYDLILWNVYLTPDGSGYYTCDELNIICTNII